MSTPARRRVARPARPEPGSSAGRRPRRPAAIEATTATASERILAAALSAFAERGFHGATTREIAAAADVPQGLVAYHFTSKQALWEAAVDWIFAVVRDDLEAAIETLRDVDPIARLRAVMKRLARLVARHPELHRFMTHEGAQDGPRLHWLADRHLGPLYARSTALIREALPRIDAAQFHYAMIGAISHAFAVAPEYARVAGRDVRAPAKIERHASEVVDWLIDGALAQTETRRPRAGR